MTGILSILRVPSSSIPSFVIGSTPAFPNDNESIKRIITPKCLQRLVQSSKYEYRRHTKQSVSRRFLYQVLLSSVCHSLFVSRKSESVNVWLPKPLSQAANRNRGRANARTKLVEMEWNDYSDFGRWRGILQLLIFWVSLVLLGKRNTR